MLKNFPLLKNITALLLVTMGCPVFAAGPIPNGGFESGSLDNWVGGGQQGGVAEVASENYCFSGFDTTGLSLSGNYAAMLRPGIEASGGSFVTLTSAPFTAGIGVSFNALTQTMRKPRLEKMPVEFIVRILSPEGASLAELGLNTHTVTLNFGCPGLPVNGAFFTHFVDTRRFLGQPIRIEFIQRVKKPGIRLMTLIDDVTRFEAGESQVFVDRPRAVAGFSQSSGGRLRLDGSLSTDPIGGALEYLWRVHEETFDREGEFPCIDDLPSGRHQATLVVSNGLSSHADDLFFVIPKVVNNTAADPVPIPTEEEDEDEEDGPDSTDGGLSLDCSDSATDETDSETDSTETGNTSESNIRSNAPSLDSTAIVWKPVSESDGKLVVLTPTSLGNPGASIFNSSGSLIEAGRYVGHTNGNRATYRFNRAGSGYSAPIYLKIGNDSYEVSNPAGRYN